MKRPTIPELEAALAVATTTAAEARRRAEQLDRTAGGILGDDIAVASGIRRIPNSKAEARRFAAYDRAADAWKQSADADLEVKRLTGRLTIARRDAAAPRDLASLQPGSLVRTSLGWHKVVRVNRCSVTVETGYSWTDTIRLDRIIETRDGAE